MLARSGQLLTEHLRSVANSSAARCAKFGAASWGEAAGLLHDVGKSSAEFQARLAGDPTQVDHSTAGSQLALAHYGDVGRLLAGPIAGHHAGLANGHAGDDLATRTPLDARLTKDVPAYEAGIVNLPALDMPSLASHPTPDVAAERRGLQLATLSRMVFGALIDADREDAARHFKNDAAPQWASIGELQEAMADHAVDLVAGSADTTINRHRRRFLSRVRARALRSRGVMTATGMTGIGKTISVVAGALDHAVAIDLDRVIYIAPYTAIVDQTADVLRGAVGPDLADNIVEHHTGFREPRTITKQYIAESWSAPLVISTAVQLFESLFTDKPGRARKLHNIAKSVIVLDEAQVMPLRLLRPCVAILDELARNYGVSVILCTATQPALIERPDDRRRSFHGGFRDPVELAPDPRQAYEDMRRFRFQDAGRLSDDDLAAQITAETSALAVVNTRRHAQSLYELIQDADGAYHLSTMMCPVHRRERLGIIRDRLDDGEAVRLVSTSLIEAGVDVDFGRVWRAVAGLDQLAQTGGRLNRNARRAIDDSVLTMFTPTNADGLAPYLAPLINATRAICRQYDDPLSLEAIEAYFSRLYWARQHDGDGLDEHGILRQLNDAGLMFPHEKIAREFRMIDDAGEAVIIPYDDTALALIERMRREPTRDDVRSAQSYAVGLYPKDFEAIRGGGAVTPIDPDETYWQLVERDRYSDAIGLMTEV